jgi:hypothetical protein
MSVRVSLVAAFAVVSVISITAAVSAATPNYDGIWTVEGTTDVGPCDKTFRGDVKIQGNDLVEAEGIPVKAIGSIDAATGTGWARLTRNDGQARANGHFKGASASGAWSSNTAYCGGRWTAHKKS